MNGSAWRRNWFDEGGENYARFRPVYPAELSRRLAELSPGRGHAADVGCGTGQLTVQLAGHFDKVTGIDPSAAQLASAEPHPRIAWVAGNAEGLPLPDGSIDLVAAAQAAHWFDLPAFYREVRRVAARDGLLALISYGVVRIAGEEIQQRFLRFYREEIGRYWPPERRMVDEGYAGIDFPFEELPPPELAITCEWGPGEFLGYVSTWSAVRNAREAGQGAMLDRFAGDLAERWGEDRRQVSWPVALRLGRI